jgi:hypothetical protein
MKFNSCLISNEANILVSLVNIYGVIGCIGWKTEKRHECTNMGKVKTSRFMMATVCHVTSGSELRKFQAA